MIVSEPPPSMLRAAPKNRLGFCRALASTPPDRILPEWGTTTLWARARRVMRVEQDDDVAAVLDQALGLLDDHVGHLHVPVGRLVEGGGDHLGLDVFLHVGDFLRPLVDQQHDQHHLRIVLPDGVGQLLHQDRLAGLRRRHDQAALALADRREQVDHAHREVAGLALEDQPLVGVARLEVVEGDPVLGLLGLLVVDALDLEEGEVALTLLGRAHLAHDGVAGAQVEALDLAGRDVDVVGTVEVVPVLAAQEAVALGQDLEHPLAPDDGVGVEQRLLDPEDQVLLPEPGVVGDVELLRERMQFSHGLLLQFSDIHGFQAPRRGGRHTMWRRRAGKILSC